LEKLRSQIANLDVQLGEVDGKGRSVVLKNLDRINDLFEVALSGEQEEEEEEYSID
jgi:hypothetical protein